MSKTQSTDWPLAIFNCLVALQIKQVAYVPDSGHAQLIELCHNNKGMQMVPLTTEEEGIALLSGAWLGGARGVLLMQSSGVGNCINMLSLARTCRFPLLMLITMRGEWGEFNPWQVPMGQMTGDVLKLADVLTVHVDDAENVGATVRSVATMTFEGPTQGAVLLAQRLIGAKSFKDEN